jgi:hypothetical protein
MMSNAKQRVQYMGQWSSLQEPELVKLEQSRIGLLTR